MRYLVKRGFVRHNGALYRKGSVFNADDVDVRALIRKGVVVPADESDSTSESLEDGKKQKSKGSAKPKGTAKSGKAAESAVPAELEESQGLEEDEDTDEDGNALPDLNADDLIVDAEPVPPKQASGEAK